MASDLEIGEECVRHLEAAVDRTRMPLAEAVEFAVQRTARTVGGDPEQAFRRVAFCTIMALFDRINNLCE